MIEEVLEFSASADKSERSEEGANASGEPWFFRLFMEGLHVWFSLVWLAMCAGCAVFSVALARGTHHPAVAVVIILVFSAVFSLAGILDGFKGLRKFAAGTLTRTAVLAVIFAVLAHIFL